METVCSPYMKSSWAMYKIVSMQVKRKLQIITYQGKKCQREEIHWEKIKDGFEYKKIEKDSNWQIWKIKETLSRLIKEISIF